VEGVGNLLSEGLAKNRATEDGRAPTEVLSLIVERRFKPYKQRVPSALFGRSSVGARPSSVAPVPISAASDNG
jgi:hypothetical protein